jgi:hypothetical protein
MPPLWQYLSALGNAPLSDGDTFEQDSESYRILVIQPGHGPFDAVIQAEWLSSSKPGAPA